MSCKVPVFHGLNVKLPFSACPVSESSWIVLFSDENSRLPIDPKSATTSRIIENADVFGEAREISVVVEDMAVLDARLLG